MKNFGSETNEFKCIQCGECCIRYSLDLPDGTKKEAFEPCKYLKQSELNGGPRMSPAKCTLHDSDRKPEVCRDWPYGERRGLCIDGVCVWGRMASRVGLQRLPQKVEQVLTARWGERNKTI